MRMKRVLVVLVIAFAIAESPVCAQYMINGIVRDAVTNERLEGVNIFLTNPQTRSIVSYTLSDVEGQYSLAAESSLDTLQINVSGFNIESITGLIPEGRHNLNFSVNQKALQIREATIQSSPIKRGGDTLTYYVEQFRERADHSIGDVLRKMPGLEVSGNGTIKYNGTAINRFYIENLDMLDDRYGIATNNIQASDIAAVEIYENHQPKKVLEGWVRSDRAALNLRLKEGAKGTWNGRVEAGIGYKPFMRDVQLTPMLFTKYYQTILTYKTNNIGDDVSKELASVSGSGLEMPELIGIITPSSPPVDPRTWLQNDIHASSANGIVKLRDGRELAIDAYYVHDKQESSSSSNTTYYLDGEPSFSIVEDISSNNAKDNLHTDILYRANTREIYLEDKISFDAEKKEDFGSIWNDTGEIVQHAALPLTKVQNRLSFNRRFNKWMLSAYSNTYLGQRDSRLNIKPNPYPDILGDGEDLSQSVRSGKIYSTNSAVTSFHYKNWVLGLSCHLNMDIERLMTRLGEADSLRNDIRWHRFEGELNPSVSYSPDRRFNLDLSLPVKLAHTNVDDMPGGQDEKETTPCFSPSLSLKWELRNYVTMRLSAQHFQSLSGLYRMYGGYIMRNYRNITSMGGVLNKSRSSVIACDLSFSDVVHSLFLNAKVSGYHNSYEGTYGIHYDGILSRTVFIYEPNSGSGISVNVGTGKRFNDIGTTVKAEASYSRSWHEYYRQEQWMEGVSDSWSSSLDVSSRISMSVLVLYNGTYTGYGTHLSGNSAIPFIHTLNQRLGADLLLGKQCVVGFRASHYYNSAVESESRNMFFVNASFSFSRKRMEYIIEGNNLLNARYYGKAIFSTNTAWSSIYRLRPLSVLVKVRFSIR